MIVVDLEKKNQKFNFRISFYKYFIFDCNLNRKMQANKKKKAYTIVTRNGLREREKKDTTQRTNECV